MHTKENITLNKSPQEPVVISDKLNETFEKTKCSSSPEHLVQVPVQHEKQTHTEFVKLYNSEMEVCDHVYKGDLEILEIQNVIASHATEDPRRGETIVWKKEYFMLRKFLMRI